MTTKCLKNSHTAVTRCGSQVRANPEAERRPLRYIGQPKKKL